MQPIPINRYLVPERVEETPQGFATVTAVIQAGLPHIIPLDQSTQLVVVVPTGLALTWRELDPTVVVAQSDAETLPASVPLAPAPFGSAPDIHPQIQLRSGGVTLASVPLTVGTRSLLPGGGAAPTRIEVVALSWTLHAGSMRGAGDFGSRVTLAWRRAGAAVDQFSTPPPNPVLVKRLPPQFRLESLIGILDPNVRLFDPQLRYRRKKVFSK